VKPPLKYGISVAALLDPRKSAKLTTFPKKIKKGGEIVLSHTLCLFLILFPWEAKPDYQMFLTKSPPYSNIIWLRQP
jgi:hypothetical protein